MRLALTKRQTEVLHLSDENIVKIANSGLVGAGAFLRATEFFPMDDGVCLVVANRILCERLGPDSRARSMIEVMVQAQHGQPLHDFKWGTG